MIDVLIRAIADTCGIPDLTRLVADEDVPLCLRVGVRVVNGADNLVVVISGVEGILFFPYEKRTSRWATFGIGLFNSGVWVKRHIIRWILLILLCCAFWESVKYAALATKHVFCVIVLYAFLADVASFYDFYYLAIEHTGVSY